MKVLAAVGKLNRDRVDASGNAIDREVPGQRTAVLKSIRRLTDAGRLQEAKVPRGYVYSVTGSADQ
jgi:hypothetical protein